MTKVLYHCPCSTNHSSSSGPQQPSSSSHYLPSLYFCEECDSIRCDLCTINDLSAYYCPNCLFDVPLASVKSEKSKCPRNCFTCPICQTTLGVVASDVSNAEEHWDPTTPEASIGEPPWYLSCSTCRWDSKEIGLVFEKPTGLSLQLQKQEDNAADVIEFERLRAHFDSYLKVEDPSMSNSRSSKLLRDVPSLAKDPQFGSQTKFPRRSTVRDEKIPSHQALMTWDEGRDQKNFKETQQDLEDGKPLGHLGRKDQTRYDTLQVQHNDSNVSSLAQRWTSQADQSPLLRDLGPCRTPLRTKQTKRCPACRHIIVRPDTKPTSHKYKIRLLALNHLPDIQVRLPSRTTSLEERRRNGTLSNLNRRRHAPIGADSLQAGRTYLFEVSFFNPLDEPLTIKLHLASPAPTPNALHTPVNSPAKRDSVRRPWSVTPTASSFPVGPFNAVWELEEEDNELLNPTGHSTGNAESSDSEVDDSDDDIDMLADDREHKRSRVDLKGSREGRKRVHGILRRKGHETVIGIELVVGKEAQGDIEFPMQVTFHHKREGEAAQQVASKDGKRSFSFWTFVRLGCVSTDAATRLSSKDSTSILSAEERRSALDKRRSVMGLNVSTPSKGQTSTQQPSTPIKELQEAVSAAEAE